MLVISERTDENDCLFKRSCKNFRASQLGRLLTIGPLAPISPFLPRSPASPRIPLGPVAPFTGVTFVFSLNSPLLGGPGSPLSPCSPSAPFIPYTVSPTSPCIPGNPGGPRKPCEKGSFLLYLVRFCTSINSIVARVRLIWYYNGRLIKRKIDEYAFTQGFQVPRK